MHKQNVLIGKTLTAMKIATDKEAILFVCGDEQVVVRCDADCCSHTWVESIALPTLGFPALVTGAEEIELNGDMDTQGGELQFYGFNITTDRGEIIIDYRNESNGYYGGSLAWPDDAWFYGGVYGQNESSLEWVDIADGAVGA
jgi:hypothetical protein